MPKQKLLNVLLAVAALIAALAVATLMPFSSGNIGSDLGYSSLCPFAPWSMVGQAVSPVAPDAGTSATRAWSVFRRKIEFLDRSFRSRLRK